MAERSRAFRSFLKSRWALGLVLLLALATRLYGISSESLWLDEATSLMLARMDVRTLVAWTALDLHPPLYYTLLHFWLGLGDSELIIRSLSVLAGCGTVAVIYGLGAELFDRKVGLVAAALLALAPFHVWYSQEARMYAWVTLFFTASIFIGLRFLRRPGWFSAILYVLITTASLYTHYSAIFTIFVQNLLVLYLLLRGRMDRRKLLAWLATQLAVFVAFLPWFPIFLLPITVGGVGWVEEGPGKPSLWSVAYTGVLYMLGQSHDALPQLIRRASYVVMTGLVVLGLVPAVWSKRAEATAHSDRRPGLLSEHEALGFVLVYLVAPIASAWFVSQVFKPMYSARYMLPCLVPFVLLLGRGILRLRARSTQILAGVLVAGLMLIGVRAQVQDMEKPDWRGLVVSLQTRAKADDLIIFVPGWHAKPFDYYAQGAWEINDSIPVPIDRYGQQALDELGQAIDGHARVWLIWETEHYTDRDGQVKAYLHDRFETISDEELPLVGRVILFEAPAEAGE